MRKLLLAALCVIPFATDVAFAQEFSGEIELFEIQEGQGDDPFLFDSTFSFGTDSHAAVLKVEGGNEAAHFDVEEVEAQLLGSLSLGSSTAFLAGVRNDFRPGRDLAYGVAGIEQGFGPVDGEVYLFLSEHGDLTGASEIVAGLPLGPSTTLEPRVGLSWSAQAIEEEDIASGLTDVAFAVRLRQAIRPIFNVYVGAIHERLLGDTRDIAQANGDRTQVTRGVLGAGLSF